MVATIHTCTLEGIRVLDIEVQAQLSPGLPGFAIVGLPDKAVAESRERVKAAMHAMGITMPARKVTINLAPADIPKEGSHFDLPIALALLVVMGVVPQEAVAHYIAMGEVSLDGRLMAVSGVLPVAMHAQNVGKGMICPESVGSEAAWAGCHDILAPNSLLALINHFKGTQVLNPPLPAMEEVPVNYPDMSQIRGQESARRALEIAAAGAHNLLMFGPPGSGKSLLASCLPGILPPMDSKEILEVSMLASIAGKLNGGRLSQRRPFRDPHHSSSMAAMVGGGRKALPGEVSLAHQGVLFLDELPEYAGAVLESLRQPLENGFITVARAEAHVTYPARLQLIAAMNPCRCGYIDDPARACNKAPRCGVDYQSRISGPLLDRIDLTIEMPAVDTLEMLEIAKGESSAAVAARVAFAREKQKARYADMGLRIRTNAELGGENLQDVVRLKSDAKALLEQAVTKLKLSMRGYTRVLRVSRSIADLAGAEDVAAMHVGEALAYRQLTAQRHLEAA